MRVRTTEQLRALSPGLTASSTCLRSPLFSPALLSCCCAVGTSSVVHSGGPPTDPSFPRHCSTPAPATATAATAATATATAAVVAEETAADRKKVCQPFAVCSPIANWSQIREDELMLMLIYLGEGAIHCATGPDVHRRNNYSSLSCLYPLSCCGEVR